MRRDSWCAVAALTLVTFGSATTTAQWTQWGGPNRDFTCAVGKLADTWPDDGPPVVWSHSFASGHSTIIVDGERLYTMCRRGDQDAIVALNIADGEIVWETRYDAPTVEGMQLEFGPGPHSTPLIVGDRLFAVGAMVYFHCLDKHDGKILWAKQLADELNASNMRRGYGASPIAYNDLVILNTGGGEAGLTAFRQDTGEIAWQSETFGPGYSSPVLVRFNEEDHLVVALGPDRLGIDPATGKTRWRTTVDSQSFGIMATPLWIPPNKLFCSAGYGGGSRLFELKHADGEYTLEELWHYRKMQVVHGTMARVDNIIYGSSHGSFGPAFLMGINLDKGKPIWRKRGVAKANVLHADGHLLILDEQGYLILATPHEKGIDIHAKAKVLEEKSWTAPTLIGTRLYLRDNHTIKCLDLGQEKITTEAQRHREEVGVKS